MTHDPEMEEIEQGVCNGCGRFTLERFGDSEKVDRCTSCGSTQPSIAETRRVRESLREPTSPTDFTQPVEIAERLAIA